MLKEADHEGPWSEDPIMLNTYFCNVHREDDKVTKWIRETWEENINPLMEADTRGHDLQKLVVANMCMARLVNNIKSLEELEWPWVRWRSDIWNDVGNRMKPFWGSAYIVTTHGLKIGKLEYGEGVLKAIFATPLPTTPPNLAAYHYALQQLEGFGSFMAAQVVADLKNTNGHPLEKAEDWWTWSAHGPGSLKGLSAFCGRKITPSTYQAALTYAWSVVERRVPEMHAQDLQNCFCEYGKYMRINNHEGNTKRRYRR